jgi:hypothetical protein
MHHLIAKEKVGARPLGSLITLYSSLEYSIAAILLSIDFSRFMPCLSGNLLNL